MIKIKTFITPLLQICESFQFQRYTLFITSIYFYSLPDIRKKSPLPEPLHSRTDH